MVSASIQVRRNQDWSQRLRQGLKATHPKQKLSQKQRSGIRGEAEGWAEAPPKAAAEKPHLEAHRNQAFCRFVKPANTEQPTFL